MYICKSPRGLTLVFLHDGETPPPRVSFSRALTPSPAHRRRSSRAVVHGVAVAHHPVAGWMKSPATRDSSLTCW